MVRKVSLQVNGENIPLNPFVRDMVRNVVRGIVNSLDKIPDDIRTIEVKIEEEESN